MRLRSFLMAVFALAVPCTVAAQEALPSCATLLSAAEIGSTCGVSDFEFDVSPDNETACQITAQRDGAVSGLTVTLNTQDSPEAAQMAVELARTIGRASDDSRATAGDPGQGAEAMGQVFELLGVQDADAEEDAGVPDAEAATQDLPSLGDGGVRYVSEAAAGIGLITHTVTFSSGAVLVELKSAIVADRAGVCTVSTLEPLAQRVADRL